METLRKKRIESFEIVLEHDIDEQYQYVPGEMMKGVVVIKCNEEIKIQQLVLTLRGEGNVLWEREEKSSKKSGKFRTKELYLDYTEHLIRSSSGRPVTTLEEGPHEFVFYYQLSDSLPSSYIGKYGSVTYLIKAQLLPDRKYGADAMITNEPFLVLRTYDLSLEPFKLQPYEESCEKTIRVACLCGGKVRAFVKLNRIGFVPGEDIHLNADVSNGSPYEVTSLQAALIMISRFRANKSTAVSEQVINKHEDVYAIDQGEGRRWNDVRVTVPPFIPESSLEGCDIIDVSYLLAFQVIVDYNRRPANNLRLEIPITIGTHGVKANDNPTEDPELRPLYHRASDTQEPRTSVNLALTNDDDDEMGEIDTSLFDTEPTSRPVYRGKSTKSSIVQPEMVELEQKKEQSNPINFLYGDLVSEKDLPDSRLEGTIREGPKRAGRSKKKKAPEAPTDINRNDEAKAAEEAVDEAEDDQTKL